MIEPTNSNPQGDLIDDGHANSRRIEWDYLANGVSGGFH